MELIEEDRLLEQAQELQELIEERLRVRGETLREQIARAGRRLPRRTRARLKIVAEAQLQAEHPAMLRQVVFAAVAEAHARAREDLRAINPHYRMQGQVLSILASVVFALLVVGAALIYWARWRGLL